MSGAPRFACLLTFAVIGFAACGGDQQQSGEFSTLTYNVAGLPQEISQVNPEQHIPLISPLLNDYDIVLTQEDFDWWLPELDRLDFTNYHTRLRAMTTHPHQSARHPGPEAVGIDIEADRPVMQVGDGLGLLSRLPFDELRRIAWETCYGIADGASDCLAMKGFGMARVELGPRVFVDVYTLHAEAGGGPDDNASRAAGFAELAAYIQEHSVGNAIILGGDTNLHTNADSDDPGDVEDSQVWAKFLDATGLTDVCDALECDDPGRIDKFAYRTGPDTDIEPLSWRFEVEKFQDVTGEPLSDHDALAVTWSWSDAGS